MIGSFFTRGVTMILGYIYPAYECFKAVEQRRANLEVLRFWCQYWIIIALVTVLERIGDTFISWLPMYCEAKLAFIVYLWYPRTKGTAYIYTTFLKPYLTTHEPEIEQHLNELRTRAIDCVALYWQRGAAFAQIKFFEVLQYVAAQANRPAPQPVAQQQPPPPPPPAAPQAPPPPNNYQPPPSPPPSAPAFNGAPQGFYPPPSAAAAAAGAGFAGFAGFAVPAEFQASAPPAAPVQGFQPPPPPPHLAAEAAPYRQGFYPQIQGYPGGAQQPNTQLRTVMREQITLDEEEEEVVTPIDELGAAPAAAAAAAATASSSRYFTRSSRRTTSSGSSSRGAF